MDTSKDGFAILKEQYIEGVIADEFMATHVKEYYGAIEKDYQIGRQVQRRLKKIGRAKWILITNPANVGTKVLKKIIFKQQEAIELINKIPTSHGQKQTSKTNHLHVEFKKVVAEIQKEGDLLKKMDKFLTERIGGVLVVALIDELTKEIRRFRFRVKVERRILNGVSFILPVVFYGLSFFITLKMEFISTVLNIKYFGRTDLVLKIIVFSLTALAIDGILTKLKNKFNRYIIERSISEMLKIDVERNTLKNLHAYLHDNYSELNLS